MVHDEKPGGFNTPMSVFDVCPHAPIPVIARGPYTAMAGGKYQDPV